MSGLDGTRRSLRGRAAIVGVGETAYYRHGQSPDGEFTLCLKAILAACADAGVDPRSIDGFASYSNDRNEPAAIAAALDVREMRFSNMHWGGGGGGGAAAIANAAAAVATGLATCVVVYRALAQGEFGRFGNSAGTQTAPGASALHLPYGQMSPAQYFAPKVMRFMHDHGIGQDALRAISLACYHHAQNNPRAVMYGRPLSEAQYDASRWIAEPFHLFDCCQENDGAAAMIVVAGEAAYDFRQIPVYLLGAAMGAPGGTHDINTSFATREYASSHFRTVAQNLYEMAGVCPADVDVVQCYENFTGGVLMALVEHGLFKPEEAGEVLRLENLIAPSGKLPLNTSGGNLAECYMHGLELQVEAVRQLRGQSPNQVPSAKVALATSGPMVIPVSTALFGLREIL